MRSSDWSSDVCSSDLFAYDNESPRHRELVAAHVLASRPVSNAEYAKFVDEGGYAEPTLWLSDAWTLLRAEGWQRPLYWHADGAREFTLGGWRERDPHAPACHLSLYEADAFRSEEHTSELQSLMRISYAVFCLKKKKTKQ